MRVEGHANGATNNNFSQLSSIHILNWKNKNRNVKNIEKNTNLSLGIFNDFLRVLLNYMLQHTSVKGNRKILKKSLETFL